MKLILLVVLTLVVGFSSRARADEVYTFVVKKQEEKVKTRWNLSDWLETRDKMRLMDLWLAIHSPTPYEFFLSGAYVIPSESGSSQGSDLAFAAYATIFGLEAKRESVPITRIHGIFDFRIFGYHDQSTNITLQAGVASRDIGGQSVRNALAGVRLDIYLARYFGIGGLYRHYYDSAPNSLFGSNRFEGQAFIDFQFLRLFGTYFSETTGASPASSLVLGDSKGVNLGAKLYF
jgi:hypothetical protein